MKHCSKCKYLLPRDQFNKASNQKSGLTPWCKACLKANDAARWAALKADPVALAAHRARVMAYYHRTRSARRANALRWYAANSVRQAARHAAYLRAHPGIMDAASERRRALKAGAPVNDFTLAQWREMKAAYDNRCAYCGKKQKRLTMDHITPLYLGGSHTLHNIVPACKTCNSRKYTGPPLCPVQPLLLTTCPGS